MWIVKGGKPRCKVVVPSGAGEVLSKAAADLVRVVKKSTGRKLPLVKGGSTQEKDAVIRLVVDPSLSRSSRSALPRSDVFRITCDDESVEIAGARERAVAYGVYEFLEQVVGARWFFPGPLGEDIPENTDISVPKGSRIHKPDLSWRAVGNADIPGWTVNNKSQYYPVSGGHAYTQLLPKELFKEHPEFFSLIYGKRRAGPSQICHRADGIVERAMEYIEQSLKDKPEAQAVSFCPNDYGFFCECDKCREMDDVTKYYDYYVKEPPYGYGGPVFEAHLSERVFAFTNRVAERFAEKYPDKYLICFAYGAYRFPPEGMKIHDNVIVWLTATCVGMWNPERRKAEIEMLKSWRKVAKNIVIFEALANQCWPCLPRNVFPLVADYLKLCKRYGIKGYYTQMWGDFSTNLPTYYVASRLAWDSSRNANKELQELYKRGFGPAARYIAQYYRVFENAWKAKTEDGSLPWARSVIVTKRQYGLCSLVFTKKVMRDARKAIDKAKAAAGKGVYARRVAFVEKGMRYTELMMDAIHECLAIEDMDIPLLYSAPWLCEPFNYDYVKKLLCGGCERRIVAHAAQRALDAFDRVAAFVRPLEGKYVLSPGIVRRAESKRVREELREILRLATDEKGDKQTLKEMFGS